MPADYITKEIVNKLLVMMLSVEIQKNKLGTIGQSKS